METLEVIATKRKVTFVTTRGEKQTVEFSGSTFQELKQQVSGKYNFDSMKVVEGKTKLTIEHPQAILPLQDFYLFLMPIKSKSGAKAATTAPKRADINIQVKELIAEGGDKAKEFFNKDTSWTKKTSEELLKLIDKWNKKKTTTAIAKATPKKTAKKGSEIEDRAGDTKEGKTAVASVVQSVKEHKEEQHSEPEKSTEELQAELKDLAKGIPGIDLYK